MDITAFEPPPLKCTSVFSQQKELSGISRVACHRSRYSVFTLRESVSIELEGQIGDFPFFNRI